MAAVARCGAFASYTKATSQSVPSLVARTKLPDLSQRQKVAMDQPVKMLTNRSLSSSLKSQTGSVTKATSGIASRCMFDMKK